MKNVLIVKSRRNEFCTTLKTKDLTQDALGKKADMPYTTLAKIESNVITKPSIQTVTKIVEGLGISIDDLIK